MVGATHVRAIRADLCSVEVHQMLLNTIWPGLLATAKDVRGRTSLVFTRESRYSSTGFWTWKTPTQKAAKVESRKETALVSVAIGMRVAFQKSFAAIAK